MHPHQIASVFFQCLVLAIVTSCTPEKDPTLKPEGYASQHALTVDKGNLKGVFVDNTELDPHHKAGYNGIAQLYHAEEDSGIFVPAFAGFNLEHIFGGDSLHQLFEPRQHPMTLYRKAEDEVLLYQEPTPLSGVESLTSFKIVPPHYIDVTFECILHREDFFKHDYAGFFWASYIDNPADKKIYFNGLRENETKDSVSWIAAWSQMHGEQSTHRHMNDDHDLFFSENFNARLANHFSEFRYTAPFFFGRYKKMVLAFLFDGAEVIRFSQSPTGGGNENPAWDFQYLIPSPQTGKKYSFKVRMLYKPFISEDDILEEYAQWAGKK
ncbi:MAG: hypothetical protein WA874_10910 [Chryseosolibacter sp.]